MTEKNMSGYNGLLEPDIPGINQKIKLWENILNVQPAKATENRYLVGLSKADKQMSDEHKKFKIKTKSWKKK